MKFNVYWVPALPVAFKMLHVGSVDASDPIEAITRARAQFGLVAPIVGVN